MAALDFPSNPTNGQVYGNYTYSSSANGWLTTPPLTSLNNQVSALQTADASYNKAGMVPIVPSSVAVGSGTGTFDANGVVTFSGASTVLLNGVFNSNYRNYKVFFNLATTTNSGPANKTQIRFSTAGTPNSSTNYTYTSFYSQSGTSSNSGGTGTAQTIAFLDYGVDFEITVSSPFDAARSTETNFITSYSNTTMFGQAGYNAAVSFDGIQFLNNTFTGTAQVYGYRNA